MFILIPFHHLKIIKEMKILESVKNQGIYQIIKIKIRAFIAFFSC